MASVKRYGIGTYTDSHEFGEKHNGDFVLASDYANLVEACRHLLRCKKPKCAKCTKAFQLIGEGGEEGK